MRFNFALIKHISFAVLFFISIDKANSQETTIEDERIIFTVDSLERNDSFPEKLKIPGQTNTYRLPYKGKDFVFIYIIFVEKRDLKIKLTELRLTKSRVIDNSGKTHMAIEQTFFKKSSQKKEGWMIFEMPKDVTPVQLKYFYQYRDETPKKNEIKIGQIDIDLISRD